MILSFKKFDNLLLYLSLKVGVIFMNSQHLRLKWHFEMLDKYRPRCAGNCHCGHANCQQSSKTSGNLGQIAGRYHFWECEYGQHNDICQTPRET